MRTYRLIEGDPMDPSSTDLLLAQDTLDVGLPVPEGWKVLTGNNHQSLIATVGYRYEFEEGAL